jgi:hypothetical protein
MTAAVIDLIEYRSEFADIDAAWAEPSGPSAPERSSA